MTSAQQPRRIKWKQIAPIIVALIGATAVILTAIINKSQPQALTLSPTATSIAPQATAFSSLTATPLTPQLTLTTSSSAPYGGTLALDDPLKDNSKSYGWDETEAHCTFSGGAYHVSTSKPIGYECNTNSSATDFSNFAYQITMKIVQGSQGGICFRFTANNQSGYCFVLDLNGHYVLETVHYDNLVILKSGQSKYFFPGSGASNQIAALAKGNEIDLFINGHFINSTNDSSLPHGQIGVFIGCKGVFTDVEFTDAKVWIL